jgi:molecular chaperone DnaK
MLREHGDKISGTERGDVENALADAKKALEGGEVQAMSKARDRLQQASHKLAEAMYKSTAAPAQPGAAATGAVPPDGGDGAASAAGGQKKDEGVIDAEYVDVDEQK